MPERQREICRYFGSVQGNVNGIMYTGVFKVMLLNSEILNCFEVTIYVFVTLA
jgi:hypothetical protein